MSTEALQGGEKYKDARPHAASMSDQIRPCKCVSRLGARLTCGLQYLTQLCCRNPAPVVQQPPWSCRFQQLPQAMQLQSPVQHPAAAAHPPAPSNAADYLYRLHGCKGRRQAAAKPAACKVRRQAAAQLAASVRYATPAKAGDQHTRPEMPGTSTKAGIARGAARPASPLNEAAVDRHIC